MFRTFPLSITRSLFTVHSAMVYVIHICRQLSKRTGWSCSKPVYKSAWHITLLSLQWINSWWWTEEISETCRVSCQNKFVKLVHLVGFTIKKFVTMHGHTNVKFDLYDLAHLFQGKSPDTHWIGIWVGCRDGVCISEWKKITCPTRNRNMIPQTSIPYPSHSTDWVIQVPDKNYLGYFHSSKNLLCP
jgi:hypothetical protein